MSKEKFEEVKMKRIFIVPAKKTWKKRCTHCDLYACETGCHCLHADGFIPSCVGEDREDGKDVVFKFAKET